MKKKFTLQYLNKSGFTLVELLLVIVVLGILAALISPNFLNSLKKGRDARRKADLGQIQKALEMYYEDHKAYPLDESEFDFNNIFSDGAKIYMQKVPNDPTTSCAYYYTSNSGEDYKLYSYLENTQDEGPGVNQDGYSTNACGGCICRFGVSSSNVEP